MDPSHNESQGELSASDRVPRVRKRGGGRSEASEGTRSKTAEGNMHAEGKTNGPGEPRKDQEGEGEKENTEQGQGGQASRHAIDLNAKNTPSTSETRNQVRLRGGPSNHEAAETSTRRAWGVVSAVAPLLALGVDVHPS